MEIILLFSVGIVVIIIAAMAILKGITYRIKSPFEDLRTEISNLEKRVKDLENKGK